MDKITWEPSENLPETIRDRYDQHLANAPPLRKIRAGCAHLVGEGAQPRLIQTVHEDGQNSA